MYINYSSIAVWGYIIHHSVVFSFTKKGSAVTENLLESFGGASNIWVRLLFFFFSFFYQERIHLNTSSFNRFEGQRQGVFVFFYQERIQLQKSCLIGRVAVAGS